MLFKLTLNFRRFYFKFSMDFLKIEKLKIGNLGIFFFNFNFTTNLI